MALSDLPPPRPGLAAVVVVPARDEEALVGGCIEALCAQRGMPAIGWEILLILDGCLDGTATRARAALLEESGPLLHEVAVSGRGAGGARAHGMDIACARLESVGRPDGLIATTDADSRVAPDWLVRQLEAVEAGAEAIGGRISLDLDLDHEDAPAAATLARRDEQHLARLPTLRGDGPTEHPFFGGASIGITARGYRLVGGMEPVAALEDEGFARRIRRGGVSIHRLDSVRVRTSARTEGRATRGLARDLSLAEWMRKRTWEGSEFSLERLLAAKDRSISIILPARRVAGTIGAIVERLGPLREAGLLDELIVVDAGSADGTAEIAARFGATVLQESELLPQFGPCLGKGDAMWRAVSAARGEIVAFCDADTADFDPCFVTGLLGPILSEPGVRLVKGAFERPLLAGELSLTGEGGRVTELVARPLINLRFPALAGLEQPLAGEIAIERSLFEQLEVPAGYGVEIAMLIDAARIAGVEAIAQVRLGTRQNRHQSLRALGSMAYEVMVAAQRRSDGFPDPLPGQLVHPAAGTLRATPICEERPALRSLPVPAGAPAETPARVPA